MIENQFDNFINGKLKDHSAPVPDGLWDKLMEKQFDQFVGQSLRHHRTTVPEGLWDKIADAQLDNFIETNIGHYIAPVPSTAWDHITDGQFDQFFGQSLENYEAPVPDDIWDKVADSRFDQFFGKNLSAITAPVPPNVWGKVADVQFDQFIGDKLNNITAPVPEGMWEKIQPEEKEERRIFYWLRVPAAAAIIVCLILGGSFAAYLLIKNQQKNNKSSVIINSKEKPTPGAAIKDNKSPLDSINQAEPTVNTPAEPSATMKESATHPSPAESEKIVAPAKKESVNTLRKQNIPVTANPGKSEIETPIPNSANGNQSGGGFIANYNKKQVGKTGKNYLSVTNTQKNKGGSIPSFNQPAQDKASKEYVPDSFFNYTPPFISTFDKAVTEPAVWIKTNGYQSGISSNEALDAKHASQFKSNVICPTNRSNRNTDWLLEVYASPDFAFKSVSNVSASQQYLSKKDSSEQMQVSYTAGFRLVKPISENILLKTGLQYSQINEKYVYRSENEIKTTTVVTVRTIIRAPGDTIVVADTSVLQTIGYKNNVVKNRFRSFDVPVIVGYQFGQGDLKFAINAGVIFNVSSWYQGAILDSTLTVVPLTNKNNMIYKSSIGLGLYAGFSISKQMGDDLQIFCEPYFRYNLSNMTSAQSPYNQKFSVGGLSLGLRLNLNRN